VLIGPRSALFTPLPAIGLIVLDESHDDSYKELQGHPRYHARETALAYAQILGATTILGSATPDVVTTYRAERGKLTRLSLPKRILGHQQKVQDQAARLGIRSRYQAYGDAQAATIDLPPVRIIDMRQELMAGNRSLLSRALQQALEKTLAMNQQAILLLNRRGSASYVFCRDCGHALTCTNCDNPLTYHSARERLVCHHCNNTRQLPERCPQCNSARIKHFGAGTQRLQETIEAQFPGARTLRWDRDATRAKGAHDVILSHFIARRADVLIGTQMVAKGLDLPLVTLVGVVSADLGLNLPDYTAPERSFQLLTQVAGRAGRSLLGGLVILQTYQPDHYAIQAAAGHDYEAFYRQEIRLRRELGYPPFTRLARLVYRHHQQAAAERETRRLATEIQARIRSLALQAELIGPAPCFYRRLNRQHRWQIVIRATDPTPLIPDDLPRGWTIDVDPVSLL
jgi:primosomal protein N' (replication factor Y)